MQVAKLLKYLSSLSTQTSDQPAVANAELLANASGITAYFQKLTGPEEKQYLRSMKPPRPLLSLAFRLHAERLN